MIEQQHDDDLTQTRLRVRDLDMVATAPRTAAHACLPAVARCVGGLVLGTSHCPQGRRDEAGTPQPDPKACAAIHCVCYPAC